jgi:hypothetical protein
VCKERIFGIYICKREKSHLIKVKMEETHLDVHQQETPPFMFGRQPIGIFAFMSMSMRVSVYWLGSSLFLNFHHHLMIVDTISIFIIIIILKKNYFRTSVMFVSISFIVLMMISLAWLVFYYIQRFRYLHAKDRLSVYISYLQS